MFFMQYNPFVDLLLKPRIDVHHQHEGFFYSQRRIWIEMGRKLETFLVCSRAIAGRSDNNKPTNKTEHIFSFLRMVRKSECSLREERMGHYMSINRRLELDTLLSVY